MAMAIRPSHSDWSLLLLVNTHGMWNIIPTCYHKKGRGDFIQISLDKQWSVTSHVHQLCKIVNSSLYVVWMYVEVHCMDVHFSKYTG